MSVPGVLGHNTSPCSAQRPSCTAQATSKQQDTGEVYSPDPEASPPLCSKAYGIWTAVPEGLILTQGPGDSHGDDPSLRARGLRGISFQHLSQHLSSYGLTRVHHHLWGRHRHGFQAWGGDEGESDSLS